MAKLAIVMTPGTWHRSASFANLVPFFVGAGYACEIVSFPSTDPKVRVKDLTADISAVRDAVLFNLDAGSDVIVVSHSWSSLPVNGALDGLDMEARRKEGKTTGVLKIIYIAG